MALLFLLVEGNGMIEQKVKFINDGFLLDDAFLIDYSLNLPELPIVIYRSGFAGLKKIHPERIARVLPPQVFPTFGFEYRGFFESEGPRGKVLEEQPRDIANPVVSSSEPANLTGCKTILASWGMAGGRILDAFELSPNIDGFVAMNGSYEARRVQKARRGEKDWRAFVDFMASERYRVTRSSEALRMNPFDIYPLNSLSRKYVNNVPRKNTFYGEITDLRFAGLLISFIPEAKSKGSRIPFCLSHIKQISPCIR